MATWQHEAVGETSANHLAETIKLFWRKLGYHGIQTRVVYTPAEGKQQLGCYAVRSNIGPDGFPPKFSV